jgi:hypothetical protein
MILPAQSEPRVCYYIQNPDGAETVGSPMQGYVPIEYPKWVDGILVQDAAEEQALRVTREEPAAEAVAAELLRDNLDEKERQSR